MEEIASFTSQNWHRLKLVAEKLVNQIKRWVRVSQVPKVRFSTTSKEKAKL